MNRPLNPHQQGTYEGFLQRLQKGMRRDQFEGVQRALSGRDLEPMLAVLDSLNHLAPEAKEDRVRHVQHLYYGLGLRDVLKGVKLSDEERRTILNEIAGDEIVHPRPRKEGE